MFPKKFPKGLRCLSEIINDRHLSFKEHESFIDLLDTPKIA